MGSTDFGDAIRDVESAQLTEEERKEVLRAMMVLSRILPSIPPSIYLSIYLYEALCTMMMVCCGRPLVLSMLTPHAQPSPSVCSLAGLLLRSFIRCLSAVLLRASHHGAASRHTPLLVCYFNFIVHHRLYSEAGTRQVTKWQSWSSEKALKPHEKAANKWMLKSIGKELELVSPSLALPACTHAYAYVSE
jgi:hypothetical protein